MAAMSPALALVSRMSTSSAFAGHRCTSRILHLEPVPRATATVGGILALRHDAFEPHLACMSKDGRAVAFDMLVESDSGARPIPSCRRPWAGSAVAAGRLAEAARLRAAAG